MQEIIHVPKIRYITKPMFKIVNMFLAAQQQQKQQAVHFVTCKLYVPTLHLFNP